MRKRKYKATKRFRSVIMFFLMTVVVAVSGISIYFGVISGNKEPAYDPIGTPPPMRSLPESEKFIYVGVDEPPAENEKIVYLTFDDGPSKNVTPKILDELQKNDIKATFFVQGQYIKPNAELLRREHREGHKIANHTYSHDYAAVYASVDSFMNEINKTEGLIDEALGFEYKNRVFRFPGGSMGRNAKFKEALMNEGRYYYDWNCLGNDAVSNSIKANEIVKATINSARGKDVLVALFHDLGTKEQTAIALPEIIEYFKQEGYEFRRLPNDFYIETE